MPGDKKEKPRSETDGGSRSITSDLDGGQRPCCVIMGAQLNVTERALHAPNCSINPFTGLYSPQIQRLHAPYTPCRGTFQQRFSSQLTSLPPQVRWREELQQLNAAKPHQDSDCEVTIQATHTHTTSQDLAR